MMKFLKNRLFVREKSVPITQDTRLKKNKKISSFSFPFGKSDA